MAAKGLDINSILSDARTGGMRAVIDIGLSPADLDGRSAVLRAHDWVALTSGVHPSEVESGDLDSLLDLLRSQADSGLIVAVGEIGLDYHWDTGTRENAVALFDTQVAIAVQSDLPVVVHNREADSDVLEIIRRHRPRGVMHCFSQDAEFCRRCLDLDMHISFGGNLTYRRSDAIRESARIVPPERLLVETDAPYLSPAPVRGLPNHPGHLGFTISALAELRGVDARELAVVTGDNAWGLFGL
jgi:TatD DNase family protein